MGRFFIPPIQVLLIDTTSPRLRSAGTFVRFVKTFVIPRLDRGNQVCTDKKHYDLGIRVKPEYDSDVLWDDKI